MTYLSEHIRTKGGNFKGVCVSAVLAFFGIAPDQYKYTWSKKRGNNYDAILRRFGYSVRSRNSAFKKAKTVGQLRSLVRNYDKHEPCVYYMVSVRGHVLLMDTGGRTVVDTAPRKNDRRSVVKVRAVFKT